MAESTNALLAHEWLSPTGGSEDVFEEMIAAFPGAMIACLWNDAPERFDMPITETWLARSPLRRSKAAALPFMRSAWKRIDLDSFERLVVSSHAFAHALASRAARQGLKSYAYVHTPARYLWAPEHDGRGQNVLARSLRRPLRSIDRRATEPAVSYVANSRFVQRRIERAWGVASEVIYPPVDTALLQSTEDWSEHVVGEEAAKLAALPQHYVLGASRLVRYKRLEAAITVGEQIQLPVVIAGSGPDRERLAECAFNARVPVTFLGRVSDVFLRALYQRASIYVFMAIEDFGIMPVEAMAVGTPALVNRTGGARESVELLGGGIVAASDEAQSLREAADKALALDMSCAQSGASQFSRSRFRQQIAEWAS